MTAPSRRRVCASLAILAGLVAGLAHSAPFTPGNVVVYRIGTGTGSLVTSGNAVLLDEYSANAVLGDPPVQTIAMPTAASGANKALVASGTAVTDGLLTRSADGTCLAVPGYGRDLGASGNLVNAAIPRVVGRVTASGAFDTTTALGDAAVGGNFRGAATTDCVTFWTSGSAAGIPSGGVRATTLGSTTSTDLTSATQADTRAVAIYGGQLYASWMNSTTNSRGIGSVGTGLPVSGAQAVVRIAGLTDASFPNTYQFFFADLSPAVPGLDTLYMADGGSGVLTKFSLVGGTWVSNGTVGLSADTYRGLTGIVNGTTVTLFAVRKGGSGATGGGELVKLVDASGYNGAFAGTPATMATAATNTAFRGVALAPTVTLTPSAGPNGSILPSTPQVVAGGSTFPFTVTANPGYTALASGCGGTLAGNTFTTAPASANCTVTATFTQIPFVVTPSAGAHGSISPNAPVTLANGSTTSFTITPDTGYAFEVGGTCGGSLNANTFTTAPVTANCTVTASFTLITRTVTPSAGANGTITPATPQVIALGTTTSFTVAPAFGFTASVGGTCGGTLSGTTYTTNAVNTDCSVVASFIPLPRYTVTPSASANGTITPNAPQSVMTGLTAAFTITPAPGYSTAVRGTCGGTLAGDTFTTGPVTRDCSVLVTFSRKLVLFVGNSYTFGRVDPVMSYNTANVTDLTYAMWLANADGSNADEPHPWGGIPGVFKKLTDQAGLDYDVSISARNAASLRGHYLNSNPAGWDLRGNIASQKWDTVILQDLSDEPLPAGRGANANLPYFNAYVDKIEQWIHVGAAGMYTEAELIHGPGPNDTCESLTGASTNACNTSRVIAPANTNARSVTDVFLYQTWARPDMIAPNGTNASGTFYSAAEGLEAMTADFHNAYFGRAAANANIAGVSPVGDAFLRAVQDGVAMRDPYVPEAGKINLWHTDFFHPSKYGSYLSALVHFAKLTGMNPMMFGPGEQAAADLGIAPDSAAALQRVARETVFPDSTAPASSAAVSESPNGQGWNRHAVTVTLTATDDAGGWGVNAITYAMSGAQTAGGTLATGGSVVISAEGVTTLTHFATDLAGNAEAPHTLVVRIDSTAPMLAALANLSVDATSLAGASVTYEAAATDNSGLAPSVVCTAASGSTFSIGTSAVSCTATDAAGNSATSGFTITVAARTVTPAAGANGTITPATPQTVVPGQSASFTVSAAPGYYASVGGSCGGSLAGDTFTTAPVVADCTVSATFALITFTVTPSAGANGTISPSAAQVLPQGASTTFTVAPDAGFSATVGGTCGGTLSGNTYTLAPITADCSVTASFTLITRTVTPSAGANGTITPDSAQVIPLGTSASFQVVPAFGYSAAVGGTCGGTLSGTTFTTSAVTNDCTVAATFTPLPTYTVTPMASGNGTVTPNTARSVMQGQSTSFTVVPAPGYSMAIRGTCGGSLAGNTFTTNPITADCSVVVAFARKLVLFVGNSFTFGRVDPVMSYNTANVTDLTHAMWLANPAGTNADEPHPWGGIPGVFKKLTDQAGLDYDVSISARDAASLRDHYLNTNPAGWDLRGNIASQRWDAVVLQDLSDEPLPAGRGANANLVDFNLYVDKIEEWIHAGAPANTNARAGTEVFLYQTWARPDMIAPHGTPSSYTAAEGLETMTTDLHAAYFGRAAANPNIADVSPVGDAFLRAVQDGFATRDPYTPDAGKINLWHTDFFHPSKYGSYLSALVHFATITGIDPMTLGAGEQAAADLGIAPAVAAQLQRVARETVMPDASPPMTSASVSVPANANGWNTGSVTITFTATDNPGGWGVAAVTYALAGAQTATGSLPPGGTVTISTQGVTTVTYFATDIAGNSEAARTLAIRIDSTAPTLSVPASISVDATGPAGATVSYVATGADNSGIAPVVACAPASGSMFAIGTTTVSCAATDAAGNRATANFTVAVSGAAEQTAKLITAVLALRGINVSPAVTTLLTTYLQSALASGNNNVFCAVMAVFVKQVTALSGKSIPAASAAQLLASANRIRAVVGCH